MNELNEALKGFSDIPISVISFVFFLLLSKKENRSWKNIFLLVSLSSFIGALVHIINFGNLIKNIIWIVLYVLLFELVRRFSLQFISFIKGKNEREKTIIYVFEIVFYVVAAIGLFFYPKYDILAFVAFSFIVFLKVLICFITIKKVPSDAKLLIILLLFPIVLQIFSRIIPFAVLTEHLIIAAALFIAYKIAKKQEDI